MFNCEEGIEESHDSSMCLFRNTWKRTSWSVRELNQIGEETNHEFFARNDWFFGAGIELLLDPNPRSGFRGVEPFPRDKSISAEQDDTRVKVILYADDKILEIASLHRRFLSTGRRRSSYQHGASRGIQWDGNLVERTDTARASIGGNKSGE